MSTRVADIQKWLSLKQIVFDQNSVKAELTKIFVASNTTFKFSDVNNLVHDAVNRITPEKWRGCIRYIEENVGFG
nr:unnamed protein product [Callosobruchus chinensis]